MFRCTLDELVDTLTTEFPIIMPGTDELSPDMQTLLHIIHQGRFGQQEAMGIGWTRQTILLTDADTLLMPFRLSEDAVDNFPRKLTLLRLRVDVGRAAFGYVPQRQPRNTDAIGRHRIIRALTYRASDAETAAKLALLGPGLGQAWLEQFKK